ncbi:hypothetical protein AVEN_117972-1 [Araneus ventricosus]|uniref:Uncharacterized protein n=1 Tax=Araneus ventricosus TaxID=182803 RepID=A0A4Y2H307_ARAVE|nr:hypothetical protein AVEN_117972-1 [Araneus ventricosus]
MRAGRICPISNQRVKLSSHTQLNFYLNSNLESYQRSGIMVRELQPQNWRFKSSRPDLIKGLPWWDAGLLNDNSIYLKARIYLRAKRLANRSPADSLQLWMGFLVRHEASANQILSVFRRT